MKAGKVPGFDGNFEERKHGNVGVGKKTVKMRVLL